MSEKVPFGVKMAAWLIGGMVGAVAMALSFAVTIPMALLSAVIFVDLWHWFVVPAFGLPPISLGLAYGVRMTFGLFSVALPEKQKTEKVQTTEVVSRLIGAVIGMLSIWGMAYLVARYWTHTA